MALQGTLETFALPDVLRLLASTKKTGVLRIETDRGAGELAVVDGELTHGEAARAPRASQPADVLFELLRSTSGSFVFDADTEVTGVGGTPDSVESALASAEAQLAEWHELEAVVPSPHRLVAMNTARTDDITLTATQWRAVAKLEGGCTVDALGARLDLTEIATARTVRDLLDLGAVTLGDQDVESSAAAAAVAVPAAPPVAEPVVAESQPQPQPEPQPEPAAVDVLGSEPVFTTTLPPLPGVDDLDTASVAPDSSDSPLAPVAPLFGGSTAEPAAAAFAPATDNTAEWDSDSGFGTSPASSFFDDDDEDDPLADDPFGPDPFRIPRLPTVEDAPESSDAAEMARQLANLSPRAAQAVAAAAAATSDEERDQALAQVEEGDEPVNRGLLLKFLSSVDE